ncbi:uncharacterized protein LOC111879948 isoform X2 [Lactuca sativa]|uniref:uncharacterized protein LOC111879948 isoform X2 n=1 Tax=Lactuca sativa TaxID=4236 RepID=UPI0022AF4400|nr:uncharacterized protein LOC111879948 isoform X2 [Lactuca sativa]
MDVLPKRPEVIAKKPKLAIIVNDILSVKEIKRIPYLLSKGSKNWLIWRHCQKGSGFASQIVREFINVLQNLLTQNPEIVDDDLLTFMREKQKDKEEKGDKDKNVISKMKFDLLSEKNATHETTPMLTQTIEVLFVTIRSIYKVGD